MNKNFLELKVGDYIWYYDHCKLHKQIVKSIDYENINIDNEFINYTYMIIKAGHGTVLKLLYSPYLKYDKIYINGLLRFSSYETAKRYVNNIIHKRRSRVEKLRDKYEKELKMLYKYEY